MLWPQPSSMTEPVTFQPDPGGCFFCEKVPPGLASRNLARGLEAPPETGCFTLTLEPRHSRCSIKNKILSTYIPCLFSKIGLSI